MKHAEKYYLENDDSALKVPNRWSTTNDILGWVSGVLFLAGIGSFILFASINLKPEGKEEVKVSANNPQETKAVPPTQQDGRGAKIPDIQAVPTKSVEAGAVIPPMQVAPPTSQGGDGAGDSGGSGE